MAANIRMEILASLRQQSRVKERTSDFMLLKKIFFFTLSKRENEKNVDLIDLHIHSKRERNLQQRVCDVISCPLVKINVHFIIYSDVYLIYQICLCSQYTLIVLFMNILAIIIFLLVYMGKFFG